MQLFLCGYGGYQHGILAFGLALTSVLKGAEAPFSVCAILLKDVKSITFKTKERENGLKSIGKDFRKKHQIR